MSVTKVEPIFVERVWGRNDLAPLFGYHDKKIGEVWFPLGDEFPLLVKFLFTSDRLSIQVHPRDKYAAVHENSRGKTEMWYILFAEPGATVAHGLTRPVSKPELRASLEDGSIMDMVQLVEVKAGDTLFTPAGTIHAIGAGIIACEIQENSDVTYRLYDYGRPRELHLDRGVAVSDCLPYNGRVDFPVVCEHFITEMLEPEPGKPLSSELHDEYLLIPVEGSGTIDGQPFEAGQCWRVTPDSGVVPLSAAAAGTKILRARVC